MRNKKKKEQYSITQPGGGYGTVTVTGPGTPETAQGPGYNFQGSRNDFNKFAKPVYPNNNYQVAESPTQGAPAENFVPGNLGTLGEFIRAGARFKVFKANQQADVNRQNVASLGASRRALSEIGMANAMTNAKKTANLGAYQQESIAAQNERNRTAGALSMARVGQITSETKNTGEINSLREQYAKEEDPAKKDIIRRRLIDLGSIEQQVWKPIKVNTGKIDKFNNPIIKTMLINHQGQVKPISFTQNNDISNFIKDALSTGGVSNQLESSHSPVNYSQGANNNPQVAASRPPAPQVNQGLGANKKPPVEPTQTPPSGKNAASNVDSFLNGQVNGAEILGSVAGTSIKALVNGIQKSPKIMEMANQYALKTNHNIGQALLDFAKWAYSSGSVSNQLKSSHSPVNYSQGANNNPQVAASRPPAPQVNQGLGANKKPPVEPTQTPPSGKDAASNVDSFLNGQVNGAEILGSVAGASINTTVNAIKKSPKIMEMVNQYALKTNRNIGQALLDFAKWAYSSGGRDMASKYQLPKT